MNAEAQIPQAGEIDPFLEAYLEPFRDWLAQDDVTELLINRPGEVWISPACLPRYGDRCRAPGRGP